MRKLFNLAIVLAVLWGVDFFLLSGLKIIITEGAQVAAIICTVIVFCGVVLPFVIKGD